jgi:hypothetical protein
VQAALFARELNVDNPMALRGEIVLLCAQLMREMAESKEGDILLAVSCITYFVLSSISCCFEASN